MELHGVRSVEIDGVNIGHRPGDFGLHTDGHDQAIKSCFALSKVVVGTVQCNLTLEGVQFFRSLWRSERLQRTLIRTNHQVAARRLRRGTRFMRQHFTTRGQRQIKRLIRRGRAEGYVVRLERLPGPSLNMEVRKL
jgi:hypothetical protein